MIELLETKKYQTVLTRMRGSLPHDNFRKTVIEIPEGETRILPVMKAQEGITVIEIHQKPYSKVTLTYVQNAAKQESNMLIGRFFLEKGAELIAWYGMLGAQYGSLILETELLGEGSKVHERTLYFGSGTQKFDMFSTTTLKAPATSALVESRGILHEKAEGQFDAGITITQGAKRADARLFEHTLLLSPEAKMNAIPGLTINTNDVFASHSASMTRVSDEQLFYCKSRGIEEAAATRMIAEGFLAKLYNDVPEKKDIEKIIQEKICKV